MYLLTVTMYEFGQFLRILLWISLPMAVIAVLITTYLHYRNKRLQNEWEGQILLSGASDGHTEGRTGGLSGRHAGNLSGESGSLSGEISDFSPSEDGNSSYQGLLWMKRKYEEYREQMDLRYEKLKEDLARAERKYLDLLDGNGTLIAGDGNRAGEKEGNTNIEGKVTIAAKAIMIEKESALGLVAEKNAQISFLQHQLDERIKSYHELEYQGQEDRNLAGSLQGQLQESKQQYQELLLQLQAFEPQLQESQKLLEGLRQLLNEKDQMINEQRQVLTHRQTELEQREQLLNEQQGQLEKNNSLLNEQQQQLIELQQHQSNLQGQQSELAQQQSDLQGQLTEKCHLLESCEMTIFQLNSQLEEGARRSAGLVDKLECNSRLLLNIYKELDRTLHNELDSTLHNEDKIPAPARQEQEPEPMMA